MSSTLLNIQTNCMLQLEIHLLTAKTSPEVYGHCYVESKKGKIEQSMDVSLSTCSQEQIISWRRVNGRLHRLDRIACGDRIRLRQRLPKPASEFTRRSTDLPNIFMPADTGSVFLPHSNQSSRMIQLRVHDSQPNTFSMERRLSWGQGVSLFDTCTRN